MFGISFTELLLIGTVTLLVVGPSRLPAMLGTLGRWSNKLRRTLFEVRNQSGIDEILRSEGITGGLTELRELRDFVRGDLRGVGRGLSQRAMSRTGPAGARPAPTPSSGAGASGNAATPGSAAAGSSAAGAGDSPTTGGGAGVRAAPPPEADPYAGVPYDRSREYPEEGADAYGALPDDLWSLGASSAHHNDTATPAANAAGGAQRSPSSPTPSPAPDVPKPPRPASMPAASGPKPLRPPGSADGAAKPLRSPSTPAPAGVSTRSDSPPQAPRAMPSAESKPSPAVNEPPNASAGPTPAAESPSEVNKPPNASAGPTPGAESQPSPSTIDSHGHER